MLSVYCGFWGWGVFFYFGLVGGVIRDYLESLRLWEFRYYNIDGRFLFVLFIECIAFRVGL